MQRKWPSPWVDGCEQSCKRAEGALGALGLRKVQKEIRQDHQVIKAAHRRTEVGLHSPRSFVVDGRFDIEWINGSPAAAAE